MTYEEAIEYIETKTWSTTRLGLERTTELLERLENPHKKLRFIHVAGSNGKALGSGIKELCSGGDVHLERACSRVHDNEPLCAV